MEQGQLAEGPSRRVLEDLELAAVCLLDQHVTCAGVEDVEVVALRAIPDVSPTTRGVSAIKPCSKLISVPMTRLMVTVIPDVSPCGRYMCHWHEGTPHVSESAPDAPCH
eukprot:3705140-Rhodomonas_salina.3